MAFSSSSCFSDQFEAVTADAIVYDAGLCAEAMRVLKRGRITIQSCHVVRQLSRG